MSPASKSKSKEKLAARTANKEQPKASLKSTPAPANSGNGVPGSAYNPISGTFHTLETAPSASLPSHPQNNGRFRNIDETDDHSGSSLGTSADYDSLSTNDSCSGESEDHKEKTTVSINPRAESIPGSDTDKRDKIRQKNERKHQRQKERRAQELQERCNGYLMSRKLEALAQKFVAMGISSERATMALILNEGRVEESIAWLFEGGEENSKQQDAANLDGVNLKIDIADELAQIAALELKYSCTKQEVERAVVVCEGDLGKAADALKTQKQEATGGGGPSKPEQPGDPVASANDPRNNKSASSPLLKGATPMMSIQQQGRDDRDFNYTKPVATVNVQQQQQPPRKIPPVKLERVRPQVAPPLDKRRPTMISSPSPLQVAAMRENQEIRYAGSGGHEAKIHMQTPAMTLKEPVIMMQRPKSLAASPPASTGWYPNGTSGIEAIKMAAVANGGGLGHQLRNSLSGSTSQQVYPSYQSFASSPMEPGGLGRNATRSMTPTSLTRISSPLALPSSSLGLFTGWGSTSPPTVDWSTVGLMPRCDYTSVDWRLESTPVESNPLYDARSAAFISAKVSRPGGNSSGGGMYLGSLQDGSLVADPSSSSHEWTSPFNGRDLFRAPRQFVTSPPSL